MTEQRVEGMVVVRGQEWMKVAEEGVRSWH